MAMAASHGVPAFMAGQVEQRSGEIDVHCRKESWQWSVPQLREKYYGAIPELMRTVDTDRAES